MSRPLEMCAICDEPTGNAGRDEDSLYIQTTVDSEIGPLCQKCYDEYTGVKSIDPFN